jgi:hypothetical protein
MSEREKRWEAFLVDPEWIAVAARTEMDGQLVENISSQCWRLRRFLPSSETLCPPKPEPDGASLPCVAISSS